MIEDLSNKNLSSLSFVLLSRNKNEKEDNYILIYYVPKRLLKVIPKNSQTHLALGHFSYLLSSTASFIIRKGIDFMLSDFFCFTFLLEE